MMEWVWPLASFLGGAGFIGLLRFVLKNRELTLSNESALRMELQGQITKLNERIEHLESEVVEWQKKYHELYKMNADLRARLDKEQK